MSALAGAPGAALHRLLSPGPRKIVYLVGNGIFVNARGRSPQLVGLLSNHMRALSMALVPGGSLAGTLGEARSYAAQLSELRFVLQELLPFLRTLYPNSGRASLSLPSLSPGLLELERRGAAFLNALESGDRYTDTSVGLSRQVENWGRCLRLPCAVAGAAVIPLEPIQHAERGDLEVVVGKQRYRYRLDATRPLPSFLHSLNEVAAAAASRTITEHPAIRDCIADFVKLVRPLLVSCGAAKPQDLRFRDLHGSGLELQHRAGCWVLVHGPARCQEHGSRVFVGLAVRGKNRAERLAMLPGVSSTAGGFFTSDGQPSHRGICMGSREQYSHLESGRFTDAEVFLYQLDAGVIVATGQSAFHQAWRNRVKERPLLRINRATR